MNLMADQTVNNYCLVGLSRNIGPYNVSFETFVTFSNFQKIKLIVKLRYNVC